MGLYLSIIAQAAAADAAGEGITLAEILADIPHDAPAIVVYLMVAGSIALIAWKGRNKPAPPAGEGQ